MSGSSDDRTAAAVVETAMLVPRDCSPVRVQSGEVVARCVMLGERERERQ